MGSLPSLFEQENHRKGLCIPSQPIFEPLGDTLPEAEIHARLVEAMGGEPLGVEELTEAAEKGRDSFVETFTRLSAENPDLGAKLPTALYRSLGRSLGEMGPAAVMFGSAMQASMRFPDSIRAAGIKGDGLELANNLFDALLEAKSGIIFSTSDYATSFDRIKTSDGKIHIYIEELEEELQSLATEEPASPSDAYPFVLTAGEHRGSTVNDVIRDPSWRKKDKDGALRIHPADADKLGVVDGQRVKIVTKRGEAEAPADITDSMMEGQVSLPHGFGMEYPDETGEHRIHGVAVNELTDIEDRDWLALTPHHKHVRARLEAVPG